MSGPGAPRSRELYAEACRYLPAGVNSPVRAFKSVGGQPLYIERGDRAHLIDADGRRYLDCCGSWGPLILGHAHPAVLAAVAEACRAGMSFGAPHAGEIELARRVVEAYPGIEMVRFTSSGTEAVMAAVRIARGHTGRDLIVKFSGCYHGHSDALLVEGGSGLATFGVRSSAGVPEGAVADTCVLPLDDSRLLADLFARRGADVAAVLIEPVPANNGLLPQDISFLQQLRSLTAEHGALLIFDEVISGWRVHAGGAATLYGVTPDMATFGKVIGGGMPVGAFAASGEIMASVAPLGNVYQAGTLSGNPVAMAAGVATLDALEAESVFERLEQLGRRLQEGVSEAAATAGASFVRVGSLFWLAFQSESPRRSETIDTNGMARFADLHTFLLERGIYFPPSGYEVCFLNAAMTEADVDRLAAALQDGLARIPRA